VLVLKAVHVTLCAVGKCPRCTLNIMPGVGVDATVQDKSSGLATVVVTKKNNATVAVAPFDLGTKGY
jgi:hypothetical protein